jgi:hypothetical protein
MHVHADVPVARHDGLARVEPDANADRASVELRLRLARSGECVRSAREGDEERVALRVDLDPAVLRERVAQ